MSRAPWTVVPAHREIIGQTSVRSASGQRVAVVMSDADAALIAQAPALLHTARLARDLIAQLPVRGAGQTLRIIDAVIAAAEGK